MARLAKTEQRLVPSIKLQTPALLIKGMANTFRPVRHRVTYEIVTYESDTFHL
jgi:hypothetical protein